MCLCPLTGRWSGILILLFCGMQAAWSHDAEPIRVMSFNLRYGTANDGDDSWPLRRELVVRTIRQFQPELLGMQEVQPLQVEYLQQQFPEYHYLGWSRDASSSGEQCGILILKDRFELLNSGQFWLSETPDQKYSKSWDSSLPRVCTWGQLRDRKGTRQQLLFANTHFDHRGVQARAESGKLLMRRLVSLADKSPIILTGDFNCDEGSDAWNSLVKQGGMRDTYLQVSRSVENASGTFHGFRGTPGPARIDWILCSPVFRTESAAIDHTHDGNRYPSDHFPVTAVLLTD